MSRYGAAHEWFRRRLLAAVKPGTPCGACPSTVLRDHGRGIVEGLREPVPPVQPDPVTFQIEFRMPQGGSMLPADFWAEFIDGIRRRGDGG